MLTIAHRLHTVMDSDKVNINSKKPTDILIAYHIGVLDGYYDYSFSKIQISKYLLVLLENKGGLTLSHNKYSTTTRIVNRFLLLSVFIIIFIQ